MGRPKPAPEVVSNGEVVQVRPAMLNVHSAALYWYHVHLTLIAACVGEQLGGDEPEAPTHSAGPRKLATLSGLVDPGFRPAQKGRSVADGPESIGWKRDRLAASFARGRHANSRVFIVKDPVQGAF
jgi:hypothetical protein